MSKEGDGDKPKKRFYKKKWFWAIFTVLAIVVIAAPKDSSKQPVIKSNSQPAATASADTSAASNPPAQAKAKEPSVPTEYKSALAKATSYSDTMHMSKQGVYDQLVSEYGEKFTAEAAQYAIDNVKADWNANALAKAKEYQDQMHMSPAAIRDQLTSTYGEKFTQAEADYALQHLND